MVVSADRQEKLIGRSEQLLRGMQNAVSESASATIAHQEQLVKQGEVLLKVVETTGQVDALETALNRNLDALSPRPEPGRDAAESFGDHSTAERAGLGPRFGSPGKRRSSGRVALAPCSPAFPYRALNDRMP